MNVNSLYALVIGTLHKLRRLLEAHGHHGQADVVAELIALHAKSPDLFARKPQDGSVWGGSGAVWEVGELGPDQAKYWATLVQLADQMASSGIDCEGSRFVGDTVRKWLATGV